MGLLKSLESRKKAYLLSHFEKTEWGKNLASLKGKYKSERCFVIGNGPSLRAEDLDKIKNEYSFAFNRIYHIYSQTEWRPTFYCTQDFKMASRSQDEINEKITTPYIFTPINLKWFYDIDIKTDYYFSQLSPAQEKSAPEFTEDIPHFVGVGNTVAFTALELAAFMGFKEVYLLGVDQSFSVSVDINGNIVRDPNAKDYFCDNYNDDKDELYIPHLDVSTLAFLEAKKYADSHENFDIYNATRGGKLEIFPRVNFDDIFKE